MNALAVAFLIDYVTDLPAAQKTVFQLSTSPPTLRFAHAARTYPKEYPC